MKSEQEIRAEIARLEGVLARAKRQYLKVGVTVHIEALKWAIGDESIHDRDDERCPCGRAHTRAEHGFRGE